MANKQEYKIGDNIQLPGGDSFTVQGRDGLFLFGTVVIDGKIGFGTFDLLSNQLSDTFLEGEDAE